MAFQDKSSYRLGAKSSLRMDRGARDALRELMLAKGVRPAADRMVERLNASSSWGGFRATHGRQASWVSALSASRDSDRAKRMLTAANKAADNL